MNTLIAAAVFVAFALLLKLLLQGAGSGASFQYRKSSHLMSKAERSFFGVLCQAIDDSQVIFAKVRVADIVSPVKGMSRSNWQRAFNAISAKHFDFVLCDSGSLEILAAIELDDSSHGSKKRQKRDALLDAVCESADLPLMRVRAAKSYVVSDLQSQIRLLLMPDAVAAEPIVDQSVASPPSLAPPILEKPEVASAADPSESFEAHDESTPTCPKCEQIMVRRVAKSGQNAGQQFWGCSGFPQCRGMRRLDA